MLKTMSAALFAASMIAAPALAANSGTKSPANTTTQTQTTQPQAQTTGEAQTNAKVTPHKGKNLKTNAKMMRRHPHHTKISLHKSHSKPGTKSVAPSTNHS